MRQIEISEEVYQKLRSFICFISTLQKRPISFSEAIDELIEQYYTVEIASFGDDAAERIRECEKAVRYADEILLDLEGFQDG